MIIYPYHSEKCSHLVSDTQRLPSVYAAAWFILYACIRTYCKRLWFIPSCYCM